MAAHVSEPYASEFSESEIKELDNLFRQVGKDSLSEEFCKELASSFSSSIDRAGKPAIHWEQVEMWFQSKQSELSDNHGAGSSGSKGFFTPSKAAPNPETSIVLTGGSTSDMTELAFEAQSSRDFGWYDVAYFLSYRVLSTGELEARVRFSGFSNKHDEWVNAKEAIRERSIPLEPSECHRVKVGDPVLCFREWDADFALHVDARIIGIERRLHDIQGCRCIFVVRYCYDNVQGKAELQMISRRPTQKP